MLDVLVFGPHPDDAELGAGGAIVKAVDSGLKIGIIDLTAGEMGSKGTKEIRLKEAEIAKKILGVDFRINLGFPDGYLSFNKNQETIFSIADKIREYKPKAVLLPYWVDRHPDHISTSQIVTQALHYAKLAKLKLSHPKHLVETQIYYQLNGDFTPSYLMDISSEFERKKKAIMSFKSQFEVFSKESLPFPVEERCKYFGSLIRKEYAEGFYVKKPVLIKEWETMLM